MNIRGIHAGFYLARHAKPTKFDGKAKFDRWTATRFHALLRWIHSLLSQRMSCRVTICEHYVRFPLSEPRRPSVCLQSVSSWVAESALWTHDSRNAALLCTQRNPDTEI